MNTKAICKATWESVETLTSQGPVTYPLLRVELSGAVSLGMVPALMTQIKELTKEVSSDYIAVTDLRELKINELIKRLFILGMESAFKSLLSVKNKARLSFVIFKRDQKGVTFLKDILTEINSTSSSEVVDYSYQYVFISDPSEMSELIPKLLNL